MADRTVRSPGPLFDAAARDARARADLGMSSAAERAEKCEAGWKASALEAVRLYGLAHQRFLAEEVQIVVPEGADPRAVGAIFQEARRRGWIKADGARPANSSNRSFKTDWLSLIYGGAR